MKFVFKAQEHQSIPHFKALLITALILIAITLPIILLLLIPIIQIIVLLLSPIIYAGLQVIRTTVFIKKYRQYSQL